MPTQLDNPTTTAETCLRCGVSGVFLDPDGICLPCGKEV